jgi:hypothetical protein
MDPISLSSLKLSHRYVNKSSKKQSKILSRKLYDINHCSATPPMSLPDVILQSAQNKNRLNPQQFKSDLSTTESNNAIITIDGETNIEIIDELFNVDQDSSESSSLSSPINHSDSESIDESDYDSSFSDDDHEEPMNCFNSNPPGDLVTNSTEKSTTPTTATSNIKHNHMFNIPTVFKHHYSNGQNATGYSLRLLHGYLHD